MKFKFLLIAFLFPVLCEGQVVKNFQKYNDRIDIAIQGGRLSIAPITDSAVRIKFNKSKDERLPELIFTTPIQIPEFQVSDSSSLLKVKSKNIIVTIVLLLPTVIAIRPLLCMEFAARLKRLSKN